MSVSYNTESMMCTKGVWSDTFCQQVTECILSTRAKAAWTFIDFLTDMGTYKMKYNVHTSVWALNSLLILPLLLTLFFSFSLLFFFVSLPLSWPFPWSMGAAEGCLFDHSLGPWTGNSRKKCVYTNWVCACVCVFECVCVFACPEIWQPLFVEPKVPFST